MGLILRRASINDAELIWKMQIESFQELLEKYQDMDTNPANEAIERVIERLEQPFTYFYLLQEDRTIVGAIRVIDKKEQNESKWVSPLFILPEHRNKGFAQNAIKEVEKLHGSRGWELATILQEKGNCYLYEKMGYIATGKTELVNDRLILIFYRKD